MAPEQSVRRTEVGQDTRGSTGRWVKDASREIDREKQRDRWMEYEGGSRIATGEELCFRSSLPEICFHHADRGRGTIEEERGE